MSVQLWVTNATILTQDKSRRVRRGHIQIVDGKIEKITTRLPQRLSQTTKVIDANGLIVLPGFVQTHVHLCQTLFRNQADDLELLDWLAKRIWPMEGAHTEETLNISALLGIHELLSSGTTCILDMGTVRHTEAILEAVQRTGIRASVGKCLMDHPERTPKVLREKTDLALREAVDLFSRWNGAAHDRIRISYAPRFVISCTENLLREVAQLSKTQRALVHTHASENKKEIELVREISGCENIEYLDQLGLASERTVLAHCVWLSSNEIDILSSRRVSVAHCPSSNLKLASGIANVPLLREKGVRVALGADGAPCNNNLNMFQEMRLAALIQKPGHGPRAMRALDVLDMATREGAKALHWFDDIGSIEEGKRADLIAVDLRRPENLVVEDLSRSDDPQAWASAIVYAGQASHVTWTMVDGQIVFSKNKVKGIVTADLISRAYKAHSKIKKASGV